jgi:hypothetical protein
MESTPEMQKLLASNDWLRRKVDRQRRVRELRKYSDDYLPEMKTSALYGFLDIGPGPGELIELAMANSMDGYGWDAETPEGGMGDDYLRFCRMSHDMRGLDVTYCNDFHGIQAKFNKSLAIINSRGSIEQVLASCMNGEPHDKHHDCRKLAWDMKRGYDGLMKFMRVMHNSLLIGRGVLMIAANGASNVAWYDKVIMEIGDEVGFRRCKRFDERTHKFHA